MTRQSTFDMYQILLKHLRNLMGYTMNCQTYQSSSDTQLMVFHKVTKYMAAYSVFFKACLVVFNLRTTHANSSHNPLLSKSIYLENVRYLHRK